MSSVYLEKKVSSDWSPINYDDADDSFRQSQMAFEKELDKEYIHKVDVYLGFFTIRSAVTIIGFIQLILFLTSLIQSIQY